MSRRRPNTGALVVLVCLLGARVERAAAQDPPSPTISISGRGDSKITPNRARVELTVQTQASSAESAAIENAAKQSKVVAALRALGIANERLATSNYSITPQTRIDRSDGASKIVGYVVSNSIIADIEDLSLLGRVLDTAIATGTNDVGFVSLYSSDQEAAYRLALAAATRNARMEAESIAGAAGGKLGPIMDVTAGGPVWPQPVMAGARAMSIASQTPILSGDQTVSASVTIRWMFIQGRPPQ